MILIIDDETYIRKSLIGLLTDEGYRATAVESAEKAEEFLRTDGVELILLDIQMPGKDGITFLEDNKDRLENVPVIIISGRGDIPTAISAIRSGAHDFIEKPLNPERILLTVRQALKLFHSVRAEKELTGRILDRYRIIGQSQATEKLRSMIDKAAWSDASVLINGENGTGKELVAHQIHYRSRRKIEALVTVNLPAVPETLFESELFGHTMGAFTGAVKDRQGRFEQADSGTIFLDEIGELPMAVQPKLLRVLEGGQFQRLGSTETITVDCRTLAATNRDLEKMMLEGTFREDLFYRLNVINIPVPPLRERPEDIPILLEHFLEQLEAPDSYIFSSEAVGMMASFPWPGNVRQLKNFVHQVVFDRDPGEIGGRDVERIYHQDELSSAPAPKNENRLAAAVRQFEIGLLSRLYQKHGGNISAMARELNIDRGNLSKKLKQLEIV
jgi:two-component system nitrogen regulation response regulator NtrX